MRRSYLQQNVLEAAKDRIRRVFAEFDNVVVNISGGKDSTVVYHLSLEVAEELGRLPLNVMFIDQEAEWESVIDHVRRCMADPRVKPYWLQIPIRLFNATSTREEQAWLKCWEPGAEWIREKEEGSIQTNEMGTDRFGEIFPAFCRRYFTGPVANIAGVRTEESPARLASIVGYPCYKDITWGNKKAASRGVYTFYPIYDWSYTDVWKAIHAHGWRYCALYDYMYQYGVGVLDMRVSNVHHETAVHVLHFLQEIEPDTWNRIVARVSGTHAVNLAGEAYQIPKELPPMFETWEEYRDYLIEHLIQVEEHREIFRKRFAREDRSYLPELRMRLTKYQIGSVLVNDYHGTKASTFSAAFNRSRINFGITRTWTATPSEAAVKEDLSL